MQKVILVCFFGAILGVALAQPLSSPEAEEWEHFKNKFGRSYSSKEEELKRQNIFLNNLKSIQEHNARFQRGEKTFDLQMNKFGDLTKDEFRQRMNGYNSRAKTFNAEVYTRPEGVTVPTSVDWRDKGAVTGIKNQAQCGSCWAFSTTGSLEGQTFLKTGKLVSLSEQNLMDCSGDEGNAGCEGGLMDQGFDYIKKNGGIDTEKSYPYEAVDDSCRFKKNNVGATLTSYKDVRSESESDLQSAVATVGPISVAIDAGESSFQFYNSGIYYEEECDPQELDHGVLAVGYGSNKKGDYWIVKNSWGADWGDSGYILMARNKDNNCGIATKASYPIV